MTKCHSWGVKNHKDKNSLTLENYFSGTRLTYCMWSFVFIDWPFSLYETRRTILIHFMLINTNILVLKYMTRWKYFNHNHCVKSVRTRWFSSIFSHIWTKYGEILRISPYSVRMWKNMDQKNSEYGNFLRSESKNTQYLQCNQPLPRAEFYWLRTYF